MLDSDLFDHSYGKSKGKGGLAGMLNATGSPGNLKLPKINNGKYNPMQ